MGVALYGYEWTMENDSQEARSLTYYDVETLVEKYSTNKTYDVSTNTPFFSYSDSEGNQHEVWFEDSLSLSEKLEIVNKYEIMGIDIWRLGGEDEKIWNEILENFST